MKDQIHLFIYNDLTFKFTNVNVMFSFLISVYNDPDRRRSAVRTLRNLSQYNKAFIKFMPKFIYLINDVGYTDN